MSARPPRLARLLLRLVTPKRERRFVVGDLDEELASLAAAGQERRALRRWYWRQALGSVGPGLKRYRNARPAGPRRSGAGVERAWQDLRFSVRMLRRTPVLSLVIIATLGLGIGLSSTVFNITNAFMHKPLPFDASDRILVVRRTNAAGHLSDGAVPVSDFADLRARQSAFERLAAYTTTSVDLSEPSTADARPERWAGARFSAGVFETLRVRPIVGRTFLPADERPGAEPVIVLGYDVWQRRYRGAPDILGRTVVANGVLSTVVGVMPEGFTFPNVERVWLPLEVNPAARSREAGEGPTCTVLGRLVDGVSPGEAEAQLSTIAARLAEEHPDSHAGAGVTVVTLKRALVPAGYYGLFYTMLVIALGVLAVGCANVANLLLARGSARTHEMAMRRALGAGRGRLIGQLLTEVFVLAIAGGGVGLVLGYLGLDWFRGQMYGVLAAVGSGTDDLPFWISFEPDAHVVLFVVGATVLAAAFAGVLPAFRASAPAAREALVTGGRGSSNRRIGRLTGGLVIAQVAVSCVLLVIAGLTIASVARLTSADLGYRTEDVLTARASLPEDRYPDANSRLRFQERLLARLDAIPGVVSATVSDILPPIHAGAWTIEVEGRTPVAAGDSPRVRRGVVTPGFFRTFGTSVLQGRAFDAADGAGAPPVAIVNASFVRKYLPDGVALGRRFRLKRDAGDVPWRVVVGVVPDLRALPLDLSGVSRDEQNPAAFYVPMAQSEGPRRVIMTLRTDGPPLNRVPDLRKAVASLDPELPLVRVLSLDGAILRATWFYPVFTTLFTTFGLGALFLSALGLYGVMSFAVMQRTREMGIRMALGARSGQMVGLVMRRGLVQLGVGLAIGLLLAWLSAGAVRWLLFDVRPHDPEVFGVVLLTLLSVGLLAAFVPARRAARVDPAMTLVAE
jgi:putative ABC transport system permease protein